MLEKIGKGQIDPNSTVAREIYQEVTERLFKEITPDPGANNPQQQRSKTAV